MMDSPADNRAQMERLGGVVRKLPPLSERGPEPTIDHLDCGLSSSATQFNRERWEAEVGGHHRARGRFRSNSLEGEEEGVL